jgi:hypothetical protein
VCVYVCVCMFYSCLKHPPVHQRPFRSEKREYECIHITALNTIKPYSGFTWPYDYYIYIVHDLFNFLCSDGRCLCWLSCLLFVVCRVLLLVCVGVVCFLLFYLFLSCCFLLLLVYVYVLTITWLFLDLFYLLSIMSCIYHFNYARHAAAEKYQTQDHHQHQQQHQQQQQQKLST